MALAAGILLILDPNATPFQRIWCILEEGILVLLQRHRLQADNQQTRQALQCLAARKQPMLLDIATVVEDEARTAQLLTQGLTSREAKMEELRSRYYWEPSGWDHKFKREANFPVTIIRQGLKVDVKRAQASRKEDKTRILNALAGRPLNEIEEVCLEKHPNYTIIELGLQSTFAVAAWGRAAQEDLELLTALEHALVEDETREELVMHLPRQAQQPSICQLGTGSGQAQPSLRLEPRLERLARQLPGRRGGQTLR